jgi:hypothetical protein
LRLFRKWRQQLASMRRKTGPGQPSGFSLKRSCRTQALFPQVKRGA